jgi:hypothetical protein
MINDNDVKVLREISNAIGQENADTVTRWGERAERVVAMLHKELPDLSDEILAFIAQMVSSAAASVAHVPIAEANSALDLIFTSYSLAAARLLKIDTTPVPAEPAETKPAKLDHIGFYL